MKEEFSLKQFKGTIDTLLLISQRQLQILEFSKDQPHIQSLNMFQQQEDLLPQLRESCDRWAKKTPLNTQEKREVEKLKQDIMQPRL